MMGTDYKAFLAFLTAQGYTGQVNEAFHAFLKALDVTMAPYGAFFATDPATSSAWAVADADSAQLGVKSIA